MKILRWIAVLPAALIGSILVYAIAKLIGNLFSPVDAVGLTWYFYEFGYNLVSGAMFVVIGSFVAPEYNKTTSIVLATIGVCVCVLSLVIQLFYIGEFDIKVIIGGVASAIGCISGSIQIHEDRDAK